MYVERACIERYSHAMKLHDACEGELATILQAAGLDESYIASLERPLRLDEETRLSGNGMNVHPCIV